MAAIKTFCAVAALACLARADTIKITATGDNSFDPDTVTAAKGDILEFHFEPKNHSVVAGDYQYPCSPMQLGTGFYSGFLDTSSGEADQVFRVTINNTDPIAFYSSQGDECASGMVGMVNPSDKETLSDYKDRASDLSSGVSPGRSVYGGVLADNDSSSDDSNDSDDDSSDSSSDDDDDDNDDNDDGGNAAGALRVSMLGLLGVVGIAFSLA